MLIIPCYHEDQFGKCTALVWMLLSRQTLPRLLIIVPPWTCEGHWNLPNVKSSDSRFSHVLSCEKPLISRGTLDNVPVHRCTYIECKVIIQAHAKELSRLDHPERCLERKGFRDPGRVRAPSVGIWRDARCYAIQQILYRNVADPRAIVDLISRGEAQLAATLHPDPYIRMCLSWPTSLLVS